MKNHILFLFIALFLFACQREKNTILLDKNRTNVTFIVGEDSDDNNHYYAAATKYYLTHDTDNQQDVITNCRSLIEVKNYLAAKKTKDNKPFGAINIVAHGNEWNGLKMPIFPNSKERTTVSTLKKAMKNAAWTMLDLDKFDEQTQLHIQGCAVGKDEALLAQIKAAFGGRLQVFSSKYFVLYQDNNEKYHAEYHYSFQHPDSIFDQNKLVFQLKNRYPKSDLNWEKVLSQKPNNQPESPFIYTFKTPIHWIVTFPSESERPIFNNNESALQWLFQQEKLLQSLEKTGLDKAYFRWKFMPIQHALDNGTTVPALKIDGLCNVICVLKPILNH